MPFAWVFSLEDHATQSKVVNAFMLGLNFKCGRCNCRMMAVFLDYYMQRVVFKPAASSLLLLLHCECEIEPLWV